VKTDTGNVLATPYSFPLQF